MKKNIGVILFYVVLIALIAGAVMFLFGNQASEPTTYDQLRDYISDATA